MSVGSIYEHTRMCTCTAKTKKNIFNFLKKHFLSLNGDDWYIFCTIGVRVSISFILLLFHNSDGFTSLYFSHKHRILQITPGMGK